MAPFQSWADLVPELLCHIVGDHIADLKSHAAARCVCMAWRRALPPPSPTLLLFAAGVRWTQPYAASLRTGTSPPFPLALIASGKNKSRCVGASGDGWLALAVDEFSGGKRPTVHVTLLHPVAAAAAAVEILLPPLVVYNSCRGWTSVSKVVFAPRPAMDDFAAAAICDANRVAYVTAGAAAWAVMDPFPRLTHYADYLTDLVYADADAADDGGGGTVYCLAYSGDVYVLRLPERRRRSPVHEQLPELSLLNPPQPAESERRQWHQHQHQRNSWMMTRRLAPTRDQDPTSSLSLPDLNVPLMDPDDDESKEPDHLNEPATIEPLLSVHNTATVFAPPYDTVSPVAHAKNLVLCEGNLYQVWRNKSCAVTLHVPGGGWHSVAENEIIVLRYYPGRQLYCWDVVKDLGGHSFFVGRNNAVSMYAKGVPGVRGNCVYWIGGGSRDQAMVFDMESGSSTPCSGVLGPRQRPHRTICWYLAM